MTDCVAFANPLESGRVLSRSYAKFECNLPIKMMGIDFGYALIYERIYLMLVVAEFIPQRQARHLHVDSIGTVSIALTNYAIDVLDSNVFTSIINAAYTSIVSCWMERKKIFCCCLPYRFSPFYCLE